MEPTVSVVLTTYNEGKFLKRTVDSILNQNFKNFEFIIIDDNSSDDTRTIIEEYAASDPRIKPIYNVKRIGFTNSLNKGLKKSRGEFIARIDAGDMAHHSRLSKQVEFLKNNLEFGLVGSWAYTVDIDGNIIGKLHNPPEITPNFLYMYNGVIHPSVMYRREILDNCGFYDNRYRTEDYDLWFRVLKKGIKIANIQEFLLYYLEREKSVTYDYVKKMVLDTFKIKLKYLSDFPSFWNTISTLRSFLGVLFPPMILRILIKYQKTKKLD